MKRLLPLLALSSTAVLAQNPTASRIDEVQVYPGGALVTRLASVAAGARELVLSCVTARFDTESLQIDAPAGVNLGPVSIETLARERVPECATSPLDARIRELEDQQNSLGAEAQALDVSLGYLKAVGGGEARGTPAAGIAGTADSIRKSAQDALLRQAQNRRQQEVVEKQLAPLRLERDRLAQANPQWRTLRLRLSTAKDAELRVSYRLSQAGWSPQYRALLDTTSSALRLERLALVSQQSGEDWKNVRLRLSTVQPRQTLGLPGPTPWIVDLRPPLVAQSDERAVKAYAPMPVPPAAPAMLRAAPKMEGLEPELERFDVSVFQGSYAAEFALPGRVSIESGAQRASFGLGAESLQAELRSRVQPQQEAAAYLVAEAVRPAGSWPVGPLQLIRDGSFVGQSQLRMAGSEDKLELFFGRDEDVRVQVEPEQRNAGDKGFIGTRVERKYSRAYVVENRHRTAVNLQVIEPGPVSRHEDIKVSSQFSPAPMGEAWRKQPGMAWWQVLLDGGKSQRFTAEYVISAPKEAVVTGLR
jgi:uncharacterized protein (TIGR02231 family)